MSPLRSRYASPSIRALALGALLPCFLFACEGGLAGELPRQGTPPASDAGTLGEQPARDGGIAVDSNSIDATPRPEMKSDAASPAESYADDYVDVIELSQITVATCAQINAALGRAGPGDAVVVAAGRYENCAIEVAAKVVGTENAPIVLSAAAPGAVTFYGDETRLLVSGQHVVIQGFRWEKVSANKPLQFVGAQHCQFKHNALFEVGLARQLCPPEGRHALMIRGGSRHLLVARNDFIDFPCQGLGVQCSASSCADNTHNVFSYNYFSDAIDNGQENEGEGEQIQLGQGGNAQERSQYAIVEHNLFEDVTPSAELICDKTSDNIHRYNTFRNAYDKLSLRRGNRTRVIGNWFFDSDGIHGGGSDHEIRDNYLANSAERDPATLRYAWFALSCASDSSRDPVLNVRVERNAFIHLAPRVTLWLKGDCGGTPPTRTVFSKNLIVIDNGDLLRDDGAKDTLWEDNAIWIGGGAAARDAPSSIVDGEDPQLADDGTGVFRSLKYPDRNPQIPCRPLQRQDVGVGSVYRCDPRSPAPRSVSESLRGDEKQR